MLVDILDKMIKLLYYHHYVYSVGLRYEMIIIIIANHLLKLIKIWIRNSTTSGTRIDLQAGLGFGGAYHSLKQDYDIKLDTPSGGSRITTVALSSDQIR